MVIAYLRVSTGRQHPENQEGEINRYARQKGLTIDRWVTETVSGKTASKDRSLGRIIRRLKEGDILVVTELSRLSRSLHEIMGIMKRCIDRGVIICSTKDGYVFDDSINSKVLSFAFGLAAEIEHQLISLRTREAMAFCKSEGRHMGRKPDTGTKMLHLLSHKEEIMIKVKSGTVTEEICQEYGVSYCTFRRFWNKHITVPRTK